MRITTYQTRFNEDRIVSIVKDKSNDCPAIDQILSSENCVEMMEAVFDVSNLPEEWFWMIALDGSHNVNGVFEISHGTATSASVHPRDIFIRAILAEAVAIIIIHNHPSGSLHISEQDREVTRRIRQAGELLGITLYDHLIIADGDYVSVT